MPQQHMATILANKREGAYHRLILAAPTIAANVRVGQFASLSVGGENTGMILRRAFSIHNVNTDSAQGQTLEIIVSGHGPGTRWITEQEPGKVLDVVSPLGKGFPLPKSPANCLLIGGGYGSAPLVFLAKELKKRLCPVDFILGASTSDKLFDTMNAKRESRFFEVFTQDGSRGQQGLVTDSLVEMIQKAETNVIYACGPMPMLEAVTQIATRFGVVTQCAVEESMACGIGVCMTCVLPIRDQSGVTRMMRSCIDGPVFRGDRVRFDAIGTIPDDCVGAPGGSV
jgi:dihydroorotate dehydrogenase electron transfer subunit